LQGVTVARRRKRAELIVRNARKLFVNELHECVLEPGCANSAHVDKNGALRIHVPPPTPTAAHASSAQRLKRKRQ